MRIREATSADLPDVVALLADDGLGRGREQPTDPLPSAYLAAFEAIEADPHNLVAVAEDDAGLVGTLQLTFIPGLTRLGAWRAQVEGVRVAARARGQGIGQQLIAWSVDEARRRGCRLVQLTSDKRREDAHRFYAALGFRATHEGFKLSLDDDGAPT